MKAFLVKLLGCFSCSVAGFLLLLLAFLVVNMTTNTTISFSNEFYRTLLPFYLVIGTGISLAIAAITRFYLIVAPIVVALLIYITIPSVSA